jgi:hypothetical protein
MRPRRQLVALILAGGGLLLMVGETVILLVGVTRPASLLPRTDCPSLPFPPLQLVLLPYSTPSHGAPRRMTPGFAIPASVQHSQHGFSPYPRLSAMS